MYGRITDKGREGRRKGHAGEFFQLQSHLKRQAIDSRSGDCHGEVIYIGIIETKQRDWWRDGHRSMDGRTDERTDGYGWREEWTNEETLVIRVR